MLQMYVDSGGKACYEIGRKFVNDRLIKLMEDVMTDYAEMDASYIEKITCSEDWEKPIEEILDLDRLRGDEDFAEEALSDLLPEGTDADTALATFWSLYDLLKAEKEYKPTLVMEHVLYYVIQMRLDFCKDMPDIYDRVERIPEPGRSQMMAELREEAKELKAGDPKTWEEDVEEIAEELMRGYEDLKEYEMTCFEDTDCLFLDDMDEEEIVESGIAGALGVDFMGDGREMRIEHDGLEFGIDVSPWKMEGDDPLPF